MSQIARYLNDANNVAAFQNYFGMRRKHAEMNPQKSTKTRKVFISVLI